MEETRPIYKYSECLFEKVFVEAPLDTDGNGKRDLLAVYVRRPAATTSGLRVPAIFVANPYMLGCNEDSYELFDVDRDITPCPPGREAAAGPVEKPALPPERQPAGLAHTAPTPEVAFEVVPEWYRYFNTRGYATVFAAGLGTKGSDGFNNTGSRDEVTAFQAVIEWLGGRRRAFTNKTDNIEIKAAWCTGKVAMTGKSYLGTLAVGVASTGVPELKTIIPEAAICNWYSYFRQNGMPVSCVGWQGDDIALLARYCFSRRLDAADYPAVAAQNKRRLAQMQAESDREGGGYNAFWQERNYLNYAADFKASVLIVHGLNDWNVKTDQCAALWQMLEERQIPRKMLLHQGGHVYIHNHQSIDFTRLLHRWLDYWLYGIENGVMEDGAGALVQSNLDQYLWQASPSWPPPQAENRRFSPAPAQTAFTDDLRATGYLREEDNRADWLRAMVEKPLEDKPYRVAAALCKAENEVRISGTVKLRLEAACDRPAAALSAMLVDYGRALRLTLDTEVAEEKGLALGPEAGEMDLLRFSAEAGPSPWRVITRGWLNTQNRSSAAEKETVEPGVFYPYNIEMIPTDYTLRPGHTLGLVVYGTDAEYTPRAVSVTRFTLKEGTLQVDIPWLESP